MNMHEEVKTSDQQLERFLGRLREELGIASRGKNIGKVNAGEFLDTEQAAAYCGHGVSKFRQVIGRGLIKPCFLPGSAKPIFHRDELRRIILANRTHPESLRMVK
jgi:hypothetical protein